jgi:hypothetical protein
MKIAGQGTRHAKIKIRHTRRAAYHAKIMTFLWFNDNAEEAPKGK